MASVSRRGALLALSIGIFLVAAAPALAQSDEDPLADLNTYFRIQYAAARSATIAAVDPVIIVRFDELVILHGGDEFTVDFTPAIYDEVKAVSHLSLALYVLLAPHVEGALDVDVLRQLADLRARAVAAQTSLTGRDGFERAVLSNNRHLIARSIALIDGATAAKRVDAPSLRRFTQAMRPLILRNVDVAATAQIDGLHEAVSDFRKAVGEEVWSRTYVVVMVSRQPRPGNLQYAYFQRVMGDAAVGERLIYAENMGAVEDALNLLGTVLLDRGIGDFFFDDPARMERDLLADAAASYLGTLQTMRP